MHLFRVFIVFCYFWVFSENLSKTWVKNWVATTHINNVAILLGKTPPLQVLGHELGNSLHATLVGSMHKQSHARVTSTHIPDPLLRHHYIQQTLLSLREGLVQEQK
jgi:hypothetical protein